MNLHAFRKGIFLSIGWLLAVSQPLYSAPQAAGGASIIRAPLPSVASGLWPAFYVQSTTPTNGAAGYGQSYVTATFNRAVDGGTINKTTFKVKCGTKMITNANVQALSPNASDNKVAIFWGTEFFDKNTQCQATLTTGIKSVSGESLQKDYTWSFNTQPRDECVLNECSRFYGGILTLAQDPNAEKYDFDHFISGGDLNSMTCLAVPKDVYGDQIFPHLMGCMPIASEEAGILLLQYQDWVEGVQNCPVPVGKEAFGKEKFWWSDDPGYIASANESFDLKGDEAINTQNTVLFCYSSPLLKEWRDSCGNNTCGKAMLYKPALLKGLIR